MLELLIKENEIRGEVAAARLSVTRAAVWKAIEALRQDGVPIEANRTRGYVLAKSADIFCAASLQKELGNVPLQWHDTVGSTNTAARLWAENRAVHGSVVASAAQTGGRGRLGRQFKSPIGGVYLSIILRPNAQKEGISLLTAAAAVAVCQSAQALFGLELQIKWVNDVFYKKKKCAGILTEGVISMETGGFEHLICGIGINYAVPAFCGELGEIATSLYAENNAPLPRAILAAEIYKNFMALYNALPQRDFLADYRLRNIVPNKRVRVLHGDGYEATALSIDDEARLVVQLDNGEIQVLSSGEAMLIPD